MLSTNKLALEEERASDTDLCDSLDRSSCNPPCNTTSKILGLAQLSADISGTVPLVIRNDIDSYKCIDVATKLFLRGYNRRLHQ